MFVSSINAVKTRKSSTAKTYFILSNTPGVVKSAEFYCEKSSPRALYKD